QVLARVARTRNEELLLLVTLALGLGAAAVTQAAGLSLALGAFLAGLLINQSDYAHEMLARLLSLRDAFVALFFVTVGVLIDLRGRATWSCAASAGSAARSARRSRRSTSPTWSSRPIRTSSRACAPATCPPCSATPPSGSSWRPLRPTRPRSSSSRFPRTTARG